MVFKLEVLDSSDSLTPSLLVFCLLELAMGVQEGSSSESCIMLDDNHNDEVSMAKDCEPHIVYN